MELISGADATGMAVAGMATTLRPQGPALLDRVPCDGFPALDSDGLPWRVWECSCELAIVETFPR